LRYVDHSRLFLQFQQHKKPAAIPFEKTSASGSSCCSTKSILQLDHPEIGKRSLLSVNTVLVTKLSSVGKVVPCEVSSRWA
jgi:hypothetical protein